MRASLAAGAPPHPFRSLLSSSHHRSTAAGGQRTGPEGHRKGRKKRTGPEGHRKDPERHRKGPERHRRGNKGPEERTGHERGISPGGRMGWRTGHEQGQRAWREHGNQPFRDGWFGPM